MRVVCVMMLWGVTPAATSLGDLDLSQRWSHFIVPARCVYACVCRRHAAAAADVRTSCCCRAVSVFFAGSAVTILFHPRCCCRCCMPVSCRYDPYNRVLTRESYDQVGMRAARRAAIQAAVGARHWGLVLGTLGRQGNPRTADMLQQRLSEAGGSVTTVLLSELSPAKLAAMAGVEAWVQVACPRLSIDWGEGFTKPTLTPFETMVALGLVPGWWEQEEKGEEACGGGSGSCCVAGSGCEKQRVGQYPMDYYARGGGDWNSSYHKPKIQAAAVGNSVAR